MAAGRISEAEYRREAEEFTARELARLGLLSAHQQATQSVGVQARHRLHRCWSTVRWRRAVPVLLLVASLAVNVLLVAYRQREAAGDVAPPPPCAVLPDEAGQERTAIALMSDRQCRDGLAMLRGNCSCWRSLCPDDTNCRVNGAVCHDAGLQQLAAACNISDALLDDNDVELVARLGAVQQLTALTGSLARLAEQRQLAVWLGHAVDQRVALASCLTVCQAFLTPALHAGRTPFERGKTVVDWCSRVDQRRTTNSWLPNVCKALVYDAWLRFQSADAELAALPVSLTGTELQTLQRWLAPHSAHQAHLAALLRTGTAQPWQQALHERKAAIDSSKRLRNDYYAFLFTAAFDPHTSAGADPRALPKSRFESLAIQTRHERSLERFSLDPAFRLAEAALLQQAYNAILSDWSDFAGSLAPS